MTTAHGERARTDDRVGINHDHAAGSAPSCAVVTGVLAVDSVGAYDASGLHLQLPAGDKDQTSTRPAVASVKIVSVTTSAGRAKHGVGRL
jgi:hypothetical protein